MPKASPHHIAATQQAAAHQAADTARHDSTAAKVQPKPFVPRYLSGFPDSTGNDTAVAPMAQLPVIEAPTDAPVKGYNGSPLHDTGSMCLLLGAMFLIAVTYHSGYKYLENFMHNMFSVKRRENLFDDGTVNDTAIMVALMLNTCIMEGLLLFYGITAHFPHLASAMHQHVWLNVGTLTGCAIAFYVLQLLLYHLMGWVFGDRTSTRLWVSGFNATQLLLGLALLPVAVVTLVYPAKIAITLPIAVGLYILSRIVFVSKGFRIFFSNFQSSLYFILYLCSVEIVPPILVLLGTIEACDILQS